MDIKVHHLSIMEQRITNRCEQMKVYKFSLQREKGQLQVILDNLSQVSFMTITTINS